MIEKLKDAFDDVDNDYLVYEDITKEIIENYVGDLDKLIEDFNRDSVESDIDDKSLEKYLFELGNKLYFLSSKLETLGIKEDISKLLYKEEFNYHYLGNREKDSERKNKVTVAELTAIAESESKEQQIVNMLYSRIYSQVKMRMTSGYDIINSIRKIITKRMNEQNLSFSIPRDPNTFLMSEQ